MKIFASLGLVWVSSLLCAEAAAARPLRVYVSGESIERRNRYVAPPFTATGALNDRGGGTLRNDNEEYGWMVPLRDRLRLRAPDLVIEFVGSDVWADADDSPYTGTYPSATAEPTSAISGTSIPSWVDLRRAELEAKTFCYDVAFASRGGNDTGTADEYYKQELKDLILLLSRSSSCQANPLVVVTGHMPDDQGWGSGLSYAQAERHLFVERVQEALAELAVSNPGLRVRFADQHTPFLQNKPTTAFPSEVWSTGGVPDYAKIAREGDGYHPRRLASIYAGELAADSLDLAELRALLGNASCSVSISGPSSVCAGASVTLDAGSGFSSYLWSTGATTRTITVSPAVSTTYSVTVADASGCQATASRTVTVTAAPVATITAPASVEPGSAGNAASVADAGAGSTYAWTISGGTITAGEGTRTITFTAGASGSVALGVTVANASGCSAAGTRNVPVGGAPAGVELFLPIVLDARGQGGSHFTTELTLLSRATSNVTVTLRYATVPGGGSGSATQTLAPGEIRIIPDAIAFLRSEGLPIPQDATTKAGSLTAAFAGAAAGEVFLGGRTSTPGGGGTYGLFYPALPLEQTADAPVWIYGLRQDGSMRSNLAVVNRGDAGDAITLRITYYGNFGAVLGTPVDITLASGEWHQFGAPLQALGAATGYARVERISGSSRFVAYGVLNDATTSDGSYVPMSF